MKRFAIAMLFLTATTTLFAQGYCRRPQAPSTSYCSTDGDWNDIARCQNNNIDAIQRYNQEVDEYNECIQQNREAEQQREQREERARQEHAQHCSSFPDAYDCR